jgi:hypothetical protein
MPNCSSLQQGAEDVPLAGQPQIELHRQSKTAQSTPPSRLRCPALVSCVMSGPLRLAKGAQTHLHYGAGVRRDLQLLELDEGLLTELQANG